MKETILEETQERIKMLETDLAKYGEQNPLVIEKFKSKANLEKELKILNMKISEMQEEVNGMDQNRVERQIQIDQAHKKIEARKKELKSMDKIISNIEAEEEEQIKRIEVYFNRRRREIGMETPHVFIRDYVKRLDTMTIQEEISIKQGETLAQVKSSLLSNVQRTIDMLESEISNKIEDIKHVKEILETQNVGGDKEHSEKHRKTLLKKFKTLVSEFNSLKIKKLKTELRLKKREEAIDAFIQHQHSQKPELERTIYYNLRYLPSDEDVVEDISSQEMRKDEISGDENRTIIDFFQLVREREQKIQKYFERKSNCNFIIKENEEIISEYTQIT